MISGCRPGLAPGTETTTVYESRPPSPPPIEFILAPFGRLDEGGNAHCHNLEPVYENASGLGLTAHEMEIITGNRSQTLNPKTKIWSYEDRRLAHPILDYLWLGPSGITRNHDFMREQAFSMILVANELRMPGQRLRTIESAAEALGIEVKYVDTRPAYEQVGSFNETLQVINNHILDSNRRNEKSKTTSPAPENQSPRRPKVLVVCETGNDRSSMIVASYIMAMYSRDLLDVCQFMLARRLSCGFDDNAKRALITWGDVLTARNDVAPLATPEGSRASGDCPRTTKRTFSDTIGMELDNEDIETGTGAQHEAMDDYDRFADREAFTPFRDVA